MSKSVNVAIIGVGNCASSFVQGVQYYKDANEDDFIPGLMHTVLGGYHVRDINFTAAIDIDSRKVGTDLADAIFSEPNNTIKFSDVPKTGITVARGMTHDGLGKYLSEIIEKAPGETGDIISLLKDTKTDVGWGHQIRSYVLDQSRIKDLRTNVEISNTQKVLDGDLDAFIEASLKQGL